jgi:hypothetical protein
MKRRLQLSLGLLIVLSIFYGGVWLLLRPPSPVNQETFMKIQGGMAKADVELLLGVPSGCDEECKTLLKPIWEDVIKGVTKRQVSSQNYGYNSSRFGPPTTKSLWAQGETWIWVEYSDQGKVVNKEISTLPRPTFAERFRYWLGF